MNIIEKLISLAVVMLLIGALIFAVSLPFNKVINKRTVYAEVTDKAVKGQNGLYLVYTVDKDDAPQVYEITDCLLKLRFDSSDVYAAIKVGEKYNFEVCGNRIRLFSMYPNIYKISVVEEEEVVSGGAL